MEARLLSIKKELSADYKRRLDTLEADWASRAAARTAELEGTHALKLQQVRKIHVGVGSSMHTCSSQKDWAHGHHALLCQVCNSIAADHIQARPGTAASTFDCRMFRCEQLYSHGMVCLVCSHPVR